MMLSEHELEQVVREVLRRLREHEITREVQAETKLQTRDSSTLELAGRLVTLGTLQGRLDGVQQVVVPRKAVVTPAARDELNKRRIALKFIAVPNGKHDKTTTPQLLLAVAAKCQPAALIKRLTAAGLELNEYHATDWKDAVRKMTTELPGTNSLGLVLTDQPAAAACLANRNPALRAAVACDVASAHSAVIEMGANMLAVNPAAQSLHVLENLIREYARTNPGGIA